MFALAAALCLSIFFILNKVYGKVDVILTIFYPSVCGVFIGTIFFCVRGEAITLLRMDALSWGVFAIIGFTSFIGLLCVGEFVVSFGYFRCNVVKANKKNKNVSISALYWVIVRYSVL